MSSYLVLARKYRPSTFDEVIGQESVTNVLRGAIQENRVGHAYLFAGPRGTGKTTTARILARCLNCENGPTVTPCGTCERCVSARQGAEVDIIELDAASHTGVDTIRELRDEVVYAPMRARHKVYIIDEVHMLSKAAFNALLKTLEEPPAHVVFLFATTEPHKVLDTVLSRCQVMRLSPISEERITERLDEVFRLEGVEAEPGVTLELARGARGGMRDALSLADKLLALAGSKPTLEDLARLGGGGAATQVEALLGAIQAADRPSVLRLLAELEGDEEGLAAGMLESLRTSLVAHHCGADAPFLSAGEEERRAAAERAKSLGADRLELWMQELLRARERMRLLPDQAPLVLEVTLLDLARPETTMPMAEMLERLEALERGAPPPERAAPAAPLRAAAPVQAAPAESREHGSVQPVSPPAQAAPRTQQPERPAQTRVPASAAPSHAAAAPPAQIWKAFLTELGKSHGALAQLIDEHASPRSAKGGPEEVSIQLVKLGEREARQATDRRNLAACARAYSSASGTKTVVRLEVQADTEAPPATPVRRREPTPSREPAPTRDRAVPSEVAPTRQPKPMNQGNQPKQAKDTFSEGVADLFDGVIEDI